MKRKRLSTFKKTTKSYPTKLSYSTQEKTTNDTVYIYGIHPVTHLVYDTSLLVNELWVQENLDHPDIIKIQKKLEETVPIQVKPKSVLDHLGYNHQGVVAIVKGKNFYKNLESIRDKKTVFILDHLEDPQNLGSLLRTADQFDIGGVIIPKNRSVGITSSVIKASSGAGLFVPIIQESSLIYVIEQLQKMGFWIYATDVKGGEDISHINFSDKVAILLGNESDGVSEKLCQKADFKITIRTSKKKKVDSLNVSTAGAIIASYLFNKRNSN